MDHFLVRYKCRPIISVIGKMCVGQSEDFVPWNYDVMI